MQVRGPTTVVIALAVAASLVAGAQTAAATHGEGAAASIAHPTHKPCGKGHRQNCGQIELSSFSFGTSRVISAPTSGASDRAGKTSIGEINVHKPKHKGR